MPPSIRKADSPRTCPDLENTVSSSFNSPGEIALAKRRIFRSFVEVTFNLTFGRARAFDAAKHDQLLDELVWYFECYFSLGVLISVTMAWIATSFILGMPTTFIDMAITIALPVFWCFSFFVIFMTKDSKKVKTPVRDQAANKAMMLV